MEKRSLKRTDQVPPGSRWEELILKDTCFVAGLREIAPTLRYLEVSLPDRQSMLRRLIQLLPALETLVINGEDNCRLPSPLKFPHALRKLVLNGKIACTVEGQIDCLKAPDEAQIKVYGEIARLEGNPQLTLFTGEAPAAYGA